MNRRGFLKAILASGVAPYVCTTAGVLMPVKPLWTPPEAAHEIIEIAEYVRLSGALTLAQLVSDTIRMHTEELTRTISDNNALFNKLKGV